jgi:hypothetical protein
LTVVVGPGLVELLFPGAAAEKEEKEEIEEDEAGTGTLCGGTKSLRIAPTTSATTTKKTLHKHTACSLQVVHRGID